MTASPWQLAVMHLEGARVLLYSVYALEETRSKAELCLAIVLLNINSKIYTIIIHALGAQIWCPHLDVYVYQAGALFEASCNGRRRRCQ